MARLLVVEDDAVLAAGLDYNLQRAGHEVVVAPDGDLALTRALAAPPPDLIILDLMLPGRSGLDVLQALRAAGSSVPVVILSALELAESLTKTRTTLLCAAIALADAALIEPVAVRAGLWRWHEPGLFGVPPIGILGWAFFTFVAGRMRSV